MAKGYWIARVDVTDPEGYQLYAKANAEPLREFGGRFLVRGGQSATPEGSARSRNLAVAVSEGICWCRTNRTRSSRLPSA